MSEILPILQGLTTPVLIVIAVLIQRFTVAMHNLDKRIIKLETHIEMQAVSRCLTCSNFAPIQTPQGTSDGNS